MARSMDADRRGAPPVEKYMPTSEELEVLNQCKREGFWKRCVPLGILFTVFPVARAVKKPPPARYTHTIGAVMFGSLAGLIVGKLSYAKVCKEKIMELPNSPIAEALRKGKTGIALMQDIMSSQQLSELPHQAPEDDRQPRFQRDDYSMRDIDTDSNIAMKGLDTSRMPSLDSASEPQRQQSPPQSFTTYDELRQRNREDYERKREARVGPSPGGRPPGILGSPDSGYISPPGAHYSPAPPSRTYSPPPPSDRIEEDPNTKKRVRRNKYGDILDE